MIYIHCYQHGNPVLSITENQNRVKFNIVQDRALKGDLQFWERKNIDCSTVSVVQYCICCSWTTVTVFVWQKVELNIRWIKVVCLYSQIRSTVTTSKIMWYGNLLHCSAVYRCITLTGGFYYQSATRPGGATLIKLECKYSTKGNCCFLRDNINRLYIYITVDIFEVIRLRIPSWSRLSSTSRVSSLSLNFDVFRLF